MCADSEKMQKAFAAREAAMLQGEQEQIADKARLAILEKKLQVRAAPRSWLRTCLAVCFNGFAIPLFVSPVAQIRSMNITITVVDSGRCSRWTHQIMVISF